jgi:hypothetical protein
MTAQARPFPGRPAGDTGEADPVAAGALGAWARGAGSERDALLAVSGARLLVPVVAMLTEADEQTGAEKESEMALPTLIGSDGRAAIIAFTCVEAVRRWRPAARPVPVPAARVWQAAVTERNAVVVDVAGPVPFVIEGARLEALAAGQAPPPAHEDPDIRSAVEAAAAAEPAVTGVTLAPGDENCDLAITLRVTGAAGTEDIRRAAQAIAVALAPRLRRAIAVSAL